MQPCLTPVCTLNHSLSPLVLTVHLLSWQRFCRIDIICSGKPYIRRIFQRAGRCTLSKTLEKSTKLKIVGLRPAVTVSKICRSSQKVHRPLKISGLSIGLREPNIWNTVKPFNLVVLKCYKLALKIILAYIMFAMFPLAVLVELLNLHYLRPLISCFWSCHEIEK